MIECKPAETPIMANHGLQIIEGVILADEGKYQRMVGKLIYISHTRPDIAYAMGIMSKFMHVPQMQHMDVVIRILRYLEGTIGRGIAFRKNGHLHLIAYTDADCRILI